MPILCSSKISEGIEIKTWISGMSANVICLERRYEFETTTPRVSDKLVISEHQRFSDISFGRTYVNITIRPDADAPDASLSDADRALAAEIDALFG